MNGTAGDVHRFLEVIRTGGKPILSSSSISAMMASSTGSMATLQGPGWGFGYGSWAVLVDRKAANTPQSNGTIQWGGVYGHNWFVDPSRKLTVVALTNTAFEGMNGQFAVALRDAIYAMLDAAGGNAAR
jgi:CubicO group peptidase (beta-lactamase class C family)